MFEKTTGNPDPMHINEYNLSIRISSDGFYLSVYDSNQTITLNQHIEADIFKLNKKELTELINNESGILDSDYQQIEIIIETDFYTFVPSALFQVKDMDVFYYFIHPKDKKNLITFNRVNTFETVNIYSLPLILHNALDKQFPENNIIHHLSYFLTQKIKTNENGIYGWVRPKMLDVVLIKDGKLWLVNSFPCQTDEDKVYYILRIADEFKVDLENTPVKLYQRDTAKELQQILSQFINNVQTYLQ